MNGFDLTIWAARVQSDGLNGSDKAVLVALASFFSAAEQMAFPSIDLICERSWCEKRTVLASIRRLESAGLIVVDRSGRRNRYTFPASISGNFDTNEPISSKNDTSGNFAPNQSANGSKIAPMNGSNFATDDETRSVAKLHPQQVQNCTYNRCKIAPLNTNLNTKETSLGPSADSDSTTKAEPQEKNFQPSSLDLRGCDPEAFREWVALRSARRTPTTQRAIDQQLSEARKADISLTEAVDFCLAHGYLAFDASGFKKVEDPSKPFRVKPPKTEAERQRRAAVLADYTPPDFNPQPVNPDQEAAVLATIATALKEGACSGKSTGPHPDRLTLPEGAS